MQDWCFVFHIYCIYTFIFFSKLKSKHLVWTRGPEWPYCKKTKYCVAPQKWTPTETETKTTHWSDDRVGGSTTICKYYTENKTPFYCTLCMILHTVTTSWSSYYIAADQQLWSATIVNQHCEFQYDRGWNYYPNSCAFNVCLNELMCSMFCIFKKNPVWHNNYTVTGLPKAIIHVEILSSFLVGNQRNAQA